MRNVKREHIRKILSYGILQTIVENTLLKIPELRKKDDSKIKSYIFNKIFENAKRIQK